MKQLIPILSILLLANGLFAQSKLHHEEYDWDKEPKWKGKIDSLKDEGSIVLKKQVNIEMAYDASLNNSLVEYRTVHKIIRVNSDDAVEKNNKIYIPMNSAIKMVEAKARVITKDGKVINFDKENIKESEEMEEYGKFNYFAVDGIEKEADIEYLYTLKEVPNYNGVAETFQGRDIAMNSGLKMIIPKNLEFKFKSYNGFPEVIQDTAIEKKNVYDVTSDYIPKLEKEQFSTYKRNLQKVIYKLDYNNYTRKNNIINFGSVSQNFYGNIHKEISKSATKKVKKLIKEAGVAKGDSDEEKVKKFEAFIKEKFKIIDGVRTEKLEKIFEDKFTNGFGIMTLYVNGLSLMEVKYEIGFACNRFNYFFDPEFESYLVLKEYFIYFPTFKKFMAPTESSYRLGMIPSSWTNSNGLFIREVSAGDFKTGLGKIKFIEALDNTKTVDNMDVTIDLEDLNAPVVNFKRSLSGYSAAYFQPIYHLIPEEKRKDLDNAYIKFASEDGEIVEYEVSGVEKSDIGINPVVFTGKLEAPSLTEKAGPKYLLKLGEVIGPQSEMYNEEERKLDIENEFNRTYDRVIKFKIPDGYKISNMDDINIDEAYPKDSPTCLFKSSYTVNGNEVTVNVDEFYNQISYDKSEYEDFRRIINAAANFNKIVLIFEKK